MEVVFILFIGLGIFLRHRTGREKWLYISMAAGIVAILLARLGLWLADISII